MEATDALNRLLAAIKAMPTDGSSAACSDELKPAWRDIGTAWIIGWATALHRDLRTIHGEIAAAAEATDHDGTHVHLENALWRLDSAREKIHAIIALAFAVPGTLKVDRGGGVAFAPNAKANRQALRKLAPEHPIANNVLQHDATLNSKLLLRHQAAHSLAPLTSLTSLAMFEVGYMRNGSVFGYEAKNLIERGLGGMKDLGSEALTERTIGEVRQGSQALVRLVESLSDLIAEAAALHPPPVVFHVMETGRAYADRGEARRVSREASPDTFPDTTTGNPHQR